MPDISSFAVYLFPEDEGQPHYLGRIRSAFIDESPGVVIPPPHNIEVRIMLGRERQIIDFDFGLPCHVAPCGPC